MKLKDHALSLAFAAAFVVCLFGQSLAVSALEAE